MDCENLTFADLNWFLEQLEVIPTKIKSVYCGKDKLRESKYVINHDEWFIDEKLDIFSLWDKVVNQSRS